jgi:putative toxin-antitoxin system antitoxin component (TIGR02293 family)
MPQAQSKKTHTAKKTKVSTSGPKLSDVLTTGSVFYQITQIRKGVPSKRFIDLSKSLGLARKELAKKLGLSERTIAGRTARPQTKLKPFESEKVLRLHEIYKQAIHVFGSEKQAREWLTSPAHGLEGQRPIDLLDTEVGGTQVREYLGAIEYGNYW